VDGQQLRRQDLLQLWLAEGATWDYPQLEFTKQAAGLTGLAARIIGQAERPFPAWFAGHFFLANLVG
jgi:hypothetical protein